MNKLIKGAGGGGGSSSPPPPRVPVEDPNTLRSRQYGKIIDALCEGEIEGLVGSSVSSVEAEKSIFLDGIPLRNSNGNPNFDLTGLVWEFKPGSQYQTSVSTNDGSIATEVQIGQTVETGTQGGGPVVYQVTENYIDSIKISMQVPRLTYQDTSNGDLKGTSVTFAIDINNNGGGYVEQGQYTISGKTIAPYTRSYQLDLPKGGPWVVRVRRITADATTSNIQNTLVWQSITKIVKQKLNYPNTALVGIKIDASIFDRIPTRGYKLKLLKVKVPSNYNPITREYSGVYWDGTFKLAWTDNPAWCWYDLATNERYGLGQYMDASSIDKWVLYEIAKYCDQLVPDGLGGQEPRFTCNLFLQTREEAIKVLFNMSSIFRGIVYWSANKLICSQDRPGDPIKSFTPANVTEGMFTYTGSAKQARHTIALVSWNDPDNEYKQTVEYVEDREGIIKFGAREVEVAAMGCTSRGQAHRLGKWTLLTEREETETVTFSTGLEGAGLSPGNIIQTTDPTRAGKRMGGRLVDATASRLTLDADVQLEIAKTYTVSILSPSGTMIEVPIVWDSTGSTTTTKYLDFNIPLTSIPQKDSIWILQANDLVAEYWRILSIVEKSPGIIEVTALEHNPSKYDAVEQNLKLEPRPTSNIRAIPEAVTNVAHLTDIKKLSETNYTTRIIVSWEPPASGTAARYLVSWRKDSGNTEIRYVSEPTIDIDDVSDGSYEITVLAQSALGFNGPAISVTHIIDGELTEPDVTNLRIEPAFLEKDCTVVWDSLPWAVTYTVQVWYSTTLLREEEITTNYYVYNYGKNLADGLHRSFTIKVKAHSLRGSSANWAVVNANNPAPAAPTSVSVTAMLEGINLRCALPSDSDYVGCRIYASKTTGFLPGSANLIYDGVDTNFSWYGLTAGDTWYLRIGCYDGFGADGIVLSSELSATVRGINVDPANTLAEINTLLTDGSGSEKIQLLADRFAIKAPTGDKYPFALVDTGGGVYKALLNADVLIGGNVDIANLTTGDLPSDVVMRLGGGTIELDGMGEIRAYAGLGANQDFVKLTAAQIQFMRYIAGTGYVTYNFLSRIEAGQANSGDTITIPGYWKTQPRIMVSPAMLGLYKKDYANQDQAINCQALNTRETAAGSGQWMFDAKATLSLAASSGGTALNISSGTITSNTFTTATQTTPANCTSITPSFSLTSVRGTGSSQYYRRSVRWRVEYYSGGTWVAGAWNAVNEGDQLGSVTASGTFTFPSAGTWQWRIAYEAYDTDGTVFGAVSYQYSTETLRMNGSKAIQTYNSSMLRVPADGPESGDGSTLTAAYSGFASDGGSVSLSGTTSKAYITTSSSGALYAQHINNDGSPSSSTDFASNYSMAANTRTAFNLGTGMSIPAFSSTWVQNAYSNARVSNFQGTAGSTITMELEYDPNIVANLVAFKICPTNSSFQYSYLKVRIAPSVTNTSWEIYKIEYSWKRKMGNSANGVSATFTAVGPDGVTDSQSGSVGYPSQGWVQKGVTFTGNNLSYDRDYLKVKINANGSYTNAYIMRDVTAVIYRRTPVTNTTTPSNTFILNSYTYDLSSAQVLATGSLNWLAIGQ